MPWDGRRKAGLPRDWSKIRLKVLRRDNYSCRWPLPYVINGRTEECGKEAHEVDHRVDRDDHRLESLWALCSVHHKRKTSQEAALGRERARSNKIKW